ncbi:MAG: PEGA domain-containing protein [Spirochaetales bacterium]|jgi:hypothetical protein|nr:PEGA domain-containing protein [Spirochaetales bacterium]
MKRFFLAVLGFFLFLLTAPAENLRGPVTALVDLSQERETAGEYPLLVNEFLAVFPGAKGDFLEGIRVSLRIPDALREAAGSYVILFYKRLSPLPTLNQTAYQGLETGNAILANRPRFSVDLPLGAIREPLSLELTLEDLPLFITLVSLSKAMPRAAENSPFFLRVSPLWSNRGRAELFFTGSPPPVSEIALWIDNERIPFAGQPLLLPSGVHSIRVQAPGFREINRTFAVNSTQTVRVELPFARQIPGLLFEAPAGTQIFLDGEKINPSQEPLLVSEGEHTVLFILEDYRISRQIHLTGNNNYKISLFLDIFVQEY